MKSILTFICMLYIYLWNMYKLEGPRICEKGDCFHGLRNVNVVSTRNKLLKEQ